MFWYFSLFFHTSWFFKTNNCPFCNKTTQDFAEFGEICGNLKAKTKTEDEGILKKEKWSSSWFLLLHITRVEWRDTPNFCYVKHPSGTLSNFQPNSGIMSIMTHTCKQNMRTFTNKPIANTLKEPLHFDAEFLLHCEKECIFCHWSLTFKQIINSIIGKTISRSRCNLASLHHQ